MKALQRNLFLFLTLGFGLIGLISCAGAEAPGSSGSSGLGEVSDGTFSHSPPLSIPAPVSRTDRPDSNEARRLCHATVKLKVTFHRPIGLMELNCTQLSSQAHFKTPTVTVTMTSGELDGTLGTETVHETQCRSDGAWHVSDLPLTGFVDLKDDCHISLNARVESPAVSETSDKTVSVEDFSDNEVREVALTIP